MLRKTRHFVILKDISHTSSSLKPPKVQSRQSHGRYKSQKPQKTSSHAKPEPTKTIETKSHQKPKAHENLPFGVLQPLFISHHAVNKIHTSKNSTPGHSWDPVGLAPHEVARAFAQKDLAVAERMRCTWRCAECFWSCQVCFLLCLDRLLVKSREATPKNKVNKLELLSSMAFCSSIIMEARLAVFIYIYIYIYIY